MEDEYLFRGPRGFKVIDGFKGTKGFNGTEWDEEFKGAEGF